MVLAGLQKLTLLDFPGRMACTVFTSGCNFRCPYCHNSSLVLPDRAHGALDEEELLAFLRKRRGVLDGVVITGGEPLLHHELPELLEKIKALGYPIKLDTNGSFPERLKALVEGGLVDFIAMDIKDSPEGYPAAVGVPELELSAVERSKEYLLTGSVDYEFRTTVVRGIHTRRSLSAAARWIAGAKAYYLQVFHDSGDLVNGSGLSAFDEQEMRLLAECVREYVPSVQLRGV